MKAMSLSDRSKVMKKIATLTVFFAAFQWVPAEITTDQVLATINKMSIAANQRDFDWMLTTVPEDGFTIEYTATGQAVVLDRAGVSAQMNAFFEKIHPETYIYGARLCSVDQQTPDTITVTLEIFESYRLIEPDVLRSTKYRQSVVFTHEGDAVVAKLARMGEVTSQDL